MLLMLATPHAVVNVSNKVRRAILKNAIARMRLRQARQTPALGTDGRQRSMPASEALIWQLGVLLRVEGCHPSLQR